MEKKSWLRLIVSGCHINAEAEPRHLFSKLKTLILCQCSIMMTSFQLCQEIDEEVTILSDELCCKRVTDVRSNSIHLLHPKLTLFIQSGTRLNFQVSHTICKWDS